MNNKEKESALIIMYMHKERWIESFSEMLNDMDIEWSNEWRLDDILI